MPRTRGLTQRAPTPPAERAGYKIDEIGASLAISRAQVYKLIRAGELNVFHIGRSPRVTPQSLADYIDRQLAAERRPA